ncbi:MAG TPA: hydantoinase/oxoprolinase family protein [Hyphomicrobiaceae bacterium]|jgi:N-methylhydantoinase A|nr:hydantoinase/oxoprolinase family protein [Hyphomicrobiaceae bacterium]
MSARIASDVGGTFTDSIAFDPASGRIAVAKVPTTPSARDVGTVEGLRAALAQLGLTGRSVGYVGHGMTTATNAVIQRTGARTAFVTNRGFKDLLLIGRQDRPSLYDTAVVRAPPLVPGELCYGIAGRLDPEGREVAPLDQGGLAEAAADMRARGVEAVAVAFLHAYANPAHELAARVVLERHLPGVAICLSSDILREFREFERASTAVLNAYLTPVMARYLGSLSARLRDTEAGLGIGAYTPIMVMEAAGGLMTVETARAKPVHTVLSGPAGGVIAGAHFAGLAGAGTVITMDIGGTSTDISLVRNGRPETTRAARIGQTPIRLPAIDINAIGAGGGSIAWIDDGGALRVGPISAEAVPGPASYGLGGTRPTVTDANLVLGRLGNDTRLGGALRLDAAAARTAIEAHVAAPLGLDVVAAAAGILRVAHANIVRGISVVSVERGHDPRQCALVPFGGAGPMHGSPVARELQIARIVVPPAPGILCALGQLLADVRHDLMQTHLLRYDPSNAERAAAIALGLSEAADRLLAADAVEPGRRSVEIRVEARYVGQSYELAIAYDHRGADGWSRLADDFHAAHKHRFGHADHDAAIEIVGFGATAIGRVERPALPLLAPGGTAPPAQALIATREVFFEGTALGDPGRRIAAPIFDRARLRAGNVIEGAAVIEEVSATTVLYPGDRSVVHATGALLVEWRR